jgi:predicted GNAT superfamily acetyltransferase
MTATDVAAVVALNNCFITEVNGLDAITLERVVKVARCCRVAYESSNGSLAGFVVAFDERTPIQGPNHRWFVDHESAFVYIDRVVVSSAFQGRGLARRFYDDLIARAGAAPLVCDINIEPLNAPSLAFHERLGFRACGDATDPRNGKRVRYMRRDPGR